jgi:hypothetical protein
MKIKVYIVFLSLFTSLLFAQKVNTTIDTIQNKIGAEFKLTLKTSFSKGDKIKFPEAKNFGTLEVINSYRIDTIKQNDVYQLEKKYGLTQFDSGRYVIPKLPISINGQLFFSDSLKVVVNDVKVDTLKQKMFELKPIAAAEQPIGNWWKYLLALIVLAITSFFGSKSYIKYKNRPKVEEIIYKSPIEKATSLLTLLEQKELWQNGQIKSYYSELTDIVRNYIEEEIQIPAMESTTSELILSLKKVANQKKMKLSAETLSNLEKVLKQADLVKFAKVIPLEFEIEQDKKRISSSIVTIHKAIPTIEENADELEQWNEQRKEEARLAKLKKEKKKKIIAAASLVVFALFFITVFFITTKGFDFVKDNILGHPTKDLSAGEWVYSEYGNPGVRLETPKVLKRLDVSKTMPKETFALIKEMEMFGYGSLLDSFYTVVSTTKFKQEKEIDLSIVIDGTIKSWEATGGQNILSKQEDFSTSEGITGVKAYGTMTMLDMVKQQSQKMYYEMLVFKQDGGLQQIIIAYKENDNYGKQILERIMNSVELKKAQ